MGNPFDCEYRDHAFNVGRITLSMSFAEVQIEHLLEFYLGEYSGRIVIKELGRNRDKSHFLFRLMENCEEDKEFVKAVQSCLAAYAIHRENRNKLVHAYAIFTEADGRTRWERASGKANIPVATAEVDLNRLEVMIDELDVLNGELAFAMWFKAYQLGYTFFSGQAQTRRPITVSLPAKFADLSSEIIANSLTTLMKRT